MRGRGRLPYNNTVIFHAKFNMPYFYAKGLLQSLSEEITVPYVEKIVKIYL
jgi:hypothetical protein